MSKNVVVAITGASGSIYALRLIEVLKSAQCTVYLVITKSAAITLKQEVDIGYAKNTFAMVDEVFDNDDIGASLASGNFEFDAIVVVPCSVNTVSSIYINRADTLIGRSALVAQKERRQVIIVPRETPVSTTTLKQLYELSLVGVTIVYASPGFYFQPKNMQELVDFIVHKIAKLLKLSITGIPEWRSNSLL